MRLKRNINYVAFLQQVRLCKDEVYFKSRDGDCLNLKSTLSEYIFVSATTSPALVDGGTIECLARQDYLLLAQYLEE